MLVFLSQEQAPLLLGSWHRRSVRFRFVEECAVFLFEFCERIRRQTRIQNAHSFAGLVDVEDARPGTSLDEKPSKL